MNFKKTYPLLFTGIFFLTLVSGITQVGAIESKAMPIDEDFSTPTPKGAVKAATATPSAKAVASASASSSAASKSTITLSKATIYKGEVSATPSAVGKLLVKTDSGDKNIDTDKVTKIYTYDSGRRVAMTLTKVRVPDKVVVIGETNETSKALLARYVMVMNKQADDMSRGSMYGVVSSREASGAAFTLQVKSPNKDETMNFVLNASSIITVKDVTAPKLSDIKIGDRVTLTYVTTKDLSTITRIHSIPGRAAGLLRDIRESTGSASAAPSASASATTKATASPRSNVQGASTAATGKPTATAKTTVKPVATAAN